MAVEPNGSIVGVESIEEEIQTESQLNEPIEEPASLVTSITFDPMAEQDLVKKGASFLEGLLGILASPESRQRLISNITETDSITGQTYLKLPINNGSVVENALNMLSGLLGGMNKK